MSQFELTPFLPHLPPSVAAVIEQASAGRGPAAPWMLNIQTGWGPVVHASGFLWRRPEGWSEEQVGWLVGMSMFADEKQGLLKTILDKKLDGVARFAVEPFVVGLLAGVPPARRQWSAAERLVALAGEVPPCLLEIVPTGLLSEIALERRVALGFARGLGDPAIQSVRAALAGIQAKKGRRRLTEALEQLEAAPPEIPVSEPPPARPPDEVQADATLAHLLDAWRACRAPELAVAIELLGANARPVEAESKAEAEEAWIDIARARDSEDVGRLLATPWPRTWPDALERVEALGAFDPDPRIAAALMKVGDRYPSLGSEPLHHATATAIAAMGDPRHVEVARRLAPRHPAYGPLAAHLASLGMGPVPDSARPVVARLLRERAEPQRLWELLWDDPSDDARRLVLADALQALGDPRGEFIVCQYAEAAGTASAAVRKRVQQLLSENIDTWTGTIPGAILGSRRFEKGFPVSIGVRFPGALPVELAELKVWRTLTHLNVLAGGRDLAPILRRARCLRSLTMPAVELGALQGTGPFPGIEIVGRLGTIAPLHLPIGLETPLGDFPDLRVVLGSTRGPIGPYDVRDLVESATAAAAMGREVALVTHRLHTPGLLAALGTAPRHRLTLIEPTTTDRDDPLMDPAWWIQVGPDGARLGRKGSERWKAYEVLEPLDALANAGWNGITLHGAVPPKVAAEVQGLARLALSFAAEPLSGAIP